LNAHRFAAHHDDKNPYDKNTRSPPPPCPKAPCIAGDQDPFLNPPNLIAFLCHPPQTPSLQHSSCWCKIGVVAIEEVNAPLPRTPSLLLNSFHDIRLGLAAVLNMRVPANTKRFHTHTSTHTHTHTHTKLEYNKNKNATSLIRLPSSHNHATHVSTGVPHLPNLPVLARRVRSASSSGIPTTLWVNFDLKSYSLAIGAVA